MRVFSLLLLYFTSYLLEKVKKRFEELKIKFDRYWFWSAKYTCIGYRYFGCRLVQWTTDRKPINNLWTANVRRYWNWAIVLLSDSLAGPQSAVRHFLIFTLISNQVYVFSLNDDIKVQTNISPYVAFKEYLKV